MQLSSLVSIRWQEPSMSMASAQHCGPRQVLAGAGRGRGSWLSEVLTHDTAARPQGEAHDSVPARHVPVASAVQALAPHDVRPGLAIALGSHVVVAGRHQPLPEQTRGVREGLAGVAGGGALRAAPVTAEPVVRQDDIATRDRSEVLPVKVKEVTQDLCRLLVSLGKGSLKVLPALLPTLATVGRREGHHVAPRAVVRLTDRATAQLFQLQARAVRGVCDELGSEVPEVCVAHGVLPLARSDGRSLACLWPGRLLPAETREVPSLRHGNGKLPPARGPRGADIG